MIMSSQARRRHATRISVCLPRSRRSIQRFREEGGEYARLGHSSKLRAPTLLLSLAVGSAVFSERNVGKFQNAVVEMRVLVVKLR